MEERTKPKPRSSSPGKKQRRAENISREQLLEALKKKRECNAKAQSIVETYLEVKNNAEDFLKHIKHINQSHYDDIVEERFILKICGYPLCDKSLEEFPKAKYRISTKTNKVYDITERIKFCSTTCFKASQYIREQMLTGPLWLRDQEVLPEFKLLDLNS